MRRIYIYTVILAGFIFTACQPGGLVKKQEAAVSPADSSFYFSSEPVADPFLDSLSIHDHTITLSKKLIPPPPPVPPPAKFKEVTGFRVQVMASTDSTKLISVKDKIGQYSKGDSLHIFPEGGLYKLQIGDYLYRYQADNLKRTIRKNGYPGAWVVQRPVLVRLQPDSTAGSAVKAKYRIQVAATSSNASAEQIRSELVGKISEPVIIETTDALFKIFAGNLDDEQAARQLLNKIRNLGYKDAWLVY